MRSRTPVILATLALAVAVVAFFVLRDSDDSDESASTSSTVAETTTTTEDQQGQGPDEDKPAEPEPAEAKIVIEGGQPVGGVAELTFTEGEDIRFEVVSDVAEEVHFHGYDVSEDVEAGGTVKFDVPATLTGVFEVELEHSVVQIAEITVNPA